MVKLLNYTLDELAEYIKAKKYEVVIYGAGMIGNISVPDYIIRKNLVENIKFFVDADSRKQSREVIIGNKACSVRTPDSLKDLNSSQILLITNSNFNPVLDILDDMEELDGIEAVIIPVLMAEETEKVKARYKIKEYSQMLIPKIIHYCWFSGNQMPEYLEKCIESWSRHCPDYEIKRWDESNYDVNKKPYMKQAYEEKKWGFVPDYARLDILYNYGGFYIDTDVELLKSLDELRTQMAFCGVEKWGNVNMGGCSGAVAHHPMIGRLLAYRESVPFRFEDGTLNTDTCGIYETQPFLNLGFHTDNSTQRIEDMTIFSSDFFHPYDYMSGRVNITDNTISIHHFNGGWLDERSRINREITLQKYDQIIKRMRSV